MTISADSATKSSLLKGNKFQTDDVLVNRDFVLLKCPVDKLNYRIIEEFPVVFGANLQILLNFEENHNAVPFVVSYKLLSKSFDVIHMKSFFKLKLIN